MSFFTYKLPQWRKADVEREIKELQWSDKLFAESFISLQRLKSNSVLTYNFMILWSDDIWNIFLLTPITVIKILVYQASEITGHVILFLLLYIITYQFLFYRWACAVGGVYTLSHFWAAMSSWILDLLLMKEGTLGHGEGQCVYFSVSLWI